MNKKIVGLIVAIVVVCAAVGTLVALSLVSHQNTKHEAQALAFTVQGTNSCLRFLESNVSLCYVPFTVGANQNWQLTINCTQMPGGSAGWTELYIYKGYWDNGTNHKCQAGDTYSILSSIQDNKKIIQGDNAFTETFNGGTNQQSYTVFFVFPNGGQGTFHVTYKQT
jgi:hypothetical protein